MANDRQSDFTTVSTVSQDKFIGVFSATENEKISRDNFIAQIKDSIDPRFIYKTISLLQAANLEVDDDEPTYVRCEETEYRLYKITSLAAGVDDITLNNGATATYQIEYRDNGFVIGPLTSTIGAIAVFSDTSGEALAEGATPTEIGNALIEIESVSQKSYARINDDDTAELITVSQLKSDLSLPSDTAGDISDINDELDLKAPLSSPVFTGNPSAPTPSANDNDTSIATTAFVQTELLDRVRFAETFDDLGAETAVVDDVIITSGYELAGVDSGSYVAKSGTADVGSTTQIDSATGGIYWEKFAENKISKVIRDIAARSAPAFSLSSLQNACMLKKLRTDYPEFAVYTPMTSDGLYWARWLFTNRFNVTNDGAPRMINCTLAGLYPATIVAKVTENKTTGTTATSPTVTKTNADGVQVGTWTSPTTTGGVANINYSTTTGDTKTWTVTGAERYTMESIFLSNGGIANVKVYTDAGLTTEIPEGNYLTPSNRLVQFLGGSNNLQHIPLCKGLNSASTYYIRTTVDATNPASGRVYQGRIFGYDDIEFDDVGIHGVVDDSSLAGQTNSRSYNPGTTVVYSCLNCTSIKWRYVETISGSIVTFKVYDSLGVEISTYINSSKDTYAPGSTAKEVVIAQGLELGDYYLHVTNGKTRNASNVASPGYRYYDFGAITYDETTAGTIGVDDFNDFDMPNIVTDPNNDSGNGTQYLLIGTGNLELAIGVRKTTEAVGDEEFVGGIHGFETTPTPVFYGDGEVIDFAGGAQFDTWVAGEIGITFSTTLKFAVDSTNFCDVDYTLILSQSGYSVTTAKETVANSYIHNEYSIMMNVPNTDMSQSGSPTQGELTGGGFEKVAADINYVINSYDNSGTFIAPRQEGVAFVNNEYMVTCNYNVEPTLEELMTVYPYSQGNDYCLIQDRTDRTIKFYTRAFDGDTTNGVLVPSGTSWTHSKTYRVAKGNFKNLFGFGI